MMLLFRISVQPRVESLIVHTVCNSQHATSIFSLDYVSSLIVSIGQFALSVQYAIRRG